jgi:hypothetical protein
MNRLPTLDEIEAGHTHDTAALVGDVDTLDALDAAQYGDAWKIGYEL